MAPQTPNIHCYSPPRNLRGICASFVGINALKHRFHVVYSKENYSLRCRWLTVNLYLAASQFSKHQSPATTLVNSCYISLYNASALTFRVECGRRGRVWKEGEGVEGGGRGTGGITVSMRVRGML